MKRKPTVKNPAKEYEFQDMVKALCKDPKFKKAYKKEVEHLKRVHAAIVAYEQIVKRLKPVWEFLNNDRTCREYMQERKITKPVDWQ